MSGVATDPTLDAPDAATARAGSRIDRDLVRGALVGRYVVLSRLGSGGMGVVYTAYDPELDRKVALKLLRTDVADGAARLLREAQALAQLSHPNVVAVHDVGTHAEDVWLAMEFVEGETLGAWLNERRSWRDVLDVMRPVARGLAAAHAAGLVHRDVKPENVMLGADGRVRVMDFGLARGMQTNTDARPERPRRSSGRFLDAAVTRAGATPGTPAYMSPEQFAGTPTDARSDQFSFCVMLWEALYGERPFAGDSIVALATVVLEGKHRSPPPRAHVPRWLRAVVHQGLAANPDDRWPSFDALLVAVDRGHARSRSSRWAALVGVVLLGAAGLWGAAQLEEQRRVAACEEAGAKIGQTWNEELRAEVRAGLLATGAGHAETTADKVMPWLDDYADNWQAARTETCKDSDHKAGWSADTVDRALWCLDERRSDLEALVAELRDADDQTVTRAVNAVAGLRDISRCRDASLLGRLPAPPTRAREDVESVRGQLARVRALRATGAYDEGLAAARRGLERAKRLEWPPLIAAARVSVAGSLHETGAYDEAEAMWETAYFEAATAGALEEVLVAALGLAGTVGLRLAREHDGERWLRHADVALAKLPDPSGLRKASNLSVLADLRHATGAYEEAAELHERALAIREKALGRDHLTVASSLMSLGVVHLTTGAYGQSVTLLKRALALREAALGRDHPTVALTLNNLAGAYYSQGENERAKELFERALAIREHALGHEHADVAQSLNNLALALEGMGDLDRARELYERAIEVWRKTLSPNHRHVAAALDNLGTLHFKQGDLEQAVTLQEKALRMREEALGAEHPEVGKTLASLASTRMAQGAKQEAVALYERALAIREKALGPTHPDVARSMQSLAYVRLETGDHTAAKRLYERALDIAESAGGSRPVLVGGSYLGLTSLALEEGRHTDAISLAERALEVLEGADLPPCDVAGARFLLARALSKGDTPTERAIALARQARDDWRDTSHDHAESLAEVESFLAELND